jgi:hypothetical protein
MREARTDVAPALLFFELTVYLIYRQGLREGKI